MASAQSLGKQQEYCIFLFNYLFLFKKSTFNAVFLENWGDIPLRGIQSKMGQNEVTALVSVGLAVAALANYILPLSR
jgi:hypothetical protein